MRHSTAGKKLGRNTDERKRLIRNLIKSMFQYGAIKTSKAKAQAIRGEVDKMITRAKQGTDMSKRDLYSRIGDKDVVLRLMEMATTRFSPRTSGYTRIIKIGPRRGDATEEVILSFVDEEVKTEVIAPASAKATAGKPEKKSSLVKTLEAKKEEVKKELKKSTSAKAAADKSVKKK